MHSDGICTRSYIHGRFFLTAEWLWSDVCIYLSAAGCKLLRLQHYQAQREMAPLVLLYKRHSAVRAHVIIVYGVILVKINGR